MPGRDLALLTEAAQAAGEIALRHWRRNPQVWDKGGGHGPVSEADLAVNEMLRARLCGARPDYGWLSEESPDDAARGQQEHVFIIDPIDGTRAFIAGEDGFSHSLAVVRRGKVVAGVVYLPAKGRLYAATAEGPALCDGKEIGVAASRALDGASVLTTAPSLAPEHWPGGVPPVRRSFRTSLAYRFCLVAEGRHDAMLTLRDAWEWDIAAGALIAAQAGARVSDKAGKALEFNRFPPQAAGVICASPDLHRGLLARLTA